MAALALVLYLLWGLLAFGLRTLLALRRTGDSGFRGISGRPGSPEWWAGTLFLVAIAAGVAAPAAALSGLRPPAFLDESAINGAGVVIAVTGILATLLAQLSMGDSWRIGVDAGERTDLVTTGAFRLVRNPIYTAMVLTSIGLTLMVPNFVALGGLAALLVALQLQVRVVEEPYLRRTHGDAYGEYAATAGRFLPGIGRQDGWMRVGGEHGRRRSR